MLEVVVEHGGQEVVRLADRVHVTDEVQVDILSGNDLCFPAAGAAALDTEVGAEGGFADADGCVMSERAEGVAQADGGGGLPFAGGGGAHGGDQDQAAVGLILAFLQLGKWDLGDEVPVWEDDFRVQAESDRDLLDFLRGTTVGWERRGLGHCSSCGRWVKECGYRA